MNKKMRENLSMLADSRKRDSNGRFIPDGKPYELQTSVKEAFVSELEELLHSMCGLCPEFESDTRIFIERLKSEIRPKEKSEAVKKLSIQECRELQDSFARVGVFFKIIPG